ncbi:hypothetical protein D3C77_595620 [compost metagenome]
MHPAHALVPPETFKLRLLAAFLIDLSADTPQQAGQIRRADRLQAVFFDPDAEGAPGVLEFAVSAQNDDFDIRHTLADESAQLQAVHERHLNVGDQNVRMKLLDQRQRDLAVRGIAAVEEAFLLPMDAVPDRLPDQNFVID